MTSHLQSFETELLTRADNRNRRLPPLTANIGGWYFVDSRAVPFSEREAISLWKRNWKAMPKQSPIPDALDKPFYDACNEERLVVQYCANCLRHQFPPRPECTRCGNDASMEWRQLSGRGRIISRVVVYDTPTSSLIPGQPFNVAAIALDEEPEVIMLSHLPGTPVDQVPIGAAVEVIFETTPATGQKVPEWRVVG